MALSALGQQRFNELRQDLCEVYGVRDLSEEFNVEPTIQQQIERRITESSSFLQAITTLGVDEMAGAKLGMSFSGFIGKRTNTKAQHDRKSVDPHRLDQSGFVVNESEYDVLIDWLTVDTWAKFPEFYTLWQAGVAQQIAENRIQAGFWGQFTAPETKNAGYAPDAEAAMYPMGQDFHMGWLQYIIHHAGADKVWGLADDGVTVEAINVGPGGDFENMDALVFDLVYSVMPRQYRERPDHRAFVGSHLYRQEVLRLYQKNGDIASEKKPLDMYINSYTFGKKSVIDVPFFPEGGVLITSPKNLAHYHQIGSHRRSIENNKHRKGIEDFNFMREDFVIEDLDMVAMVHPDAIQVPDGAGGWTPVVQEKWAVTIPEGLAG